MLRTRLHFLFFFFQAEDGIRDWSVTGVQTCALPIFCSPSASTSLSQTRSTLHPPASRAEVTRQSRSILRRILRSRSEERRVGKEGRSGGEPDHEKKNSS